MKTIQYAIEVIPKSTLTNLPHYHMNPTKHTKLKWQVDKHMNNGFI